MRDTEPAVFLVARPSINWDGVINYLDEVDSAHGTGGDALAWANNARGSHDAETLVEFGGRLCYRSWAPQLNPNVTRVRTSQRAYLANILDSEHGSVIEHATFSLVLHNVSRVLTHELVRHRVGVAISQESMRYVRLTDIPFWQPDWAKADPELLARAEAHLAEEEAFQSFLAEHFGLDDDGVPFHEKKHKTSYMRRYAPHGVSTGMLWTANLRTLRWVVQTRTDAAAEEEIRLLFHKVGELMLHEAPALFGDFDTFKVPGSDIPMWVPTARKV